MEQARAFCLTLLEGLRRGRNRASDRAASRYRSENPLAMPRQCTPRRQRSRAHADARHQRRRHILQRSAAALAVRCAGVMHANPVPALRTVGIQALHRPTGKMLHVDSPQFVFADRDNAQSLPDCARSNLVCQGQIATISRGAVSSQSAPHRGARLRRESVS